MGETKAPGAPLPSEDWAQLPWRKLEQYVYRLQTRIYRASRRGNVAAVHRLQDLLLRSQAARLLAVRRVTQDNQGKHTAGIDGVATLAPPQRLALAEHLHPHHWRRPQPVRRVWIPKPGKAELRPLGIPTLRDRAVQALAKLALEPEWEARFEPNSYGFRPGRCCQDAIDAVFYAIRRQPKYVLDADITGCFDHINHQALLAKLGTFPRLRRAIHAWLKAGVLEGGHWLPTHEGTPQGGVLSPLLANIALHGLETALTTAFRPKEGPAYLVRYADDFVVLHATEPGIHKARQVAEDWLRDLGLTLHPHKTQITHSRTPYQGRVGVDFLGFHVRQYAVGKCHTGRAAPGKPLGYKTRIAPSPDALRQHRRALARSIDAHRAAPQAALIAQLNRVIRGWTNCYRASAASYHAFRRGRDQLYAPLWRWARRRHPTKSASWVRAKYWSTKRGTGCQFQAPEGALLWKHSRTRLKRHVKVRGTASPFDGNLVYWAQRLRNSPLTRNRVSYLLRLQQGKCAVCGLYLREDDVLEIDHLVPLALGGRDVVLNMQVLHGHCHDQKTARDGSHARTSQGTHDTGCSAEEPDEVKASRPVLKTSLVGDDTA